MHLLHYSHIWCNGNCYWTKEKFLQFLWSLFLNQNLNLQKISHFLSLEDNLRYLGAFLNSKLSNLLIKIFSYLFYYNIWLIYIQSPIESITIFTFLNINVNDCIQYWIHLTITNTTIIYYLSASCLIKQCFTIKRIHQKFKKKDKFSIF